MAEQILSPSDSEAMVPQPGEPQNLGDLSTAIQFSLVYWPHQCEVIRGRIEHIDWIPISPEPLYTTTGLEMMPSCQTPDKGTVIYLEEDKNSRFMYSQVKDLCPLKQILHQEGDNTLIFEARFESGNLQKVVKVVMGERDVFMYCDIHGHNRKQNVFMYGCERRPQAKGPYVHPCVFPLLLSKSCPDKFSFPDCSFRVRKSKEGTGRVVMWKMGINNSYTLEASICGSKLGCRQSTHFDVKDLESIGQHFCDALLNYCVHHKEEHESVMKQQARVNSKVLNSDALDLDSSSQSSDSPDSCDLYAHQLKLGTKKKNKASGEHFHSTAKDRSHESKNTQGIETQHKVFQVFDPVKKVELPLAASATQVGEDLSSKSHTHNAKGNHEKTSVPQEAGKSVCHDMILSTRENFHSSSFNLFSQKMKKQKGKSVSKPAENTFQSLKGRDRAKSNSEKEERKMKERLPSKNRRLQKTRTARQDVYFGKSKFFQGQDKLQFPLPLLPEEKNRQHAAKYQSIFVSSSSLANEGT